MRIELINNSSASNSISLLGKNLTSLISQSETSISSLRSLKNFSHSMNGGVGLLQSAVDSIDARIEHEETRKGNLVEAKIKIDKYTELIGTTDRSVSNLVSQNQDMFYGVNEWSRPPVLPSQVGTWFANAKSWISGVAKKSSDAFGRTWSIYNEIDYKVLSDEELKKVCDEYAKLIESEELSPDDRIRIKSLMNYLSKISISDTPSRANQKIDLYVNLYEKMHPDEAEKMRNLFSNAPAEFKDDIRNIKFTAYKSTGECHDTFFKYADRIKIADYYATYNGEPGNYFNPQDMSMYLNIKSMRNRNNSYGTFFHEAGHNIDLLMGMDATGNKEWYSSSILSNGNFHGLVYKDVEGIVTNLVNNYSNNEKHLSDEQKSLITDVLMGRKLDSAINNSDTDFAYRKVMEDITGAWKGKYSRQYQDGREIGILETKDSGMLSEVMNGMTNNSLMVNGKYSGNVNKVMGDFFGQAHATSGHPINWQNPNAGYVPTDYYYNSDGSYTGAAETEYMAEYMRINMTNSTSEKDYVTRYLHNSWNAMSDGLKSQNNVN